MIAERAEWAELIRSGMIIVNYRKLKYILHTVAEVMKQCSAVHALDLIIWGHSWAICFLLHYHISLPAPIFGLAGLRMGYLKWF